ncbi:type II toxin-antitoxin system VapC family toxin [Tessaracoccus caeni]|uniref:type II toxin-antitoxin system VapC family toxin n=1 Tax=Tessaracoccus caeni TaxID=3031239 RepID=UPI0023DC35E2|nr:type II toxin-antitoxin system VapC family toxin [Tessaracoccus caeni]MDF1488359.1 type II toxin-antitoxin system VapC family toxin [Tessaracoccus caeni]
MIYLDSNILIYAVEDRSERGDRVRAALVGVDAPVAVSPLVLHECLVHPLREQDFELRDQYLAAYERLEHLDLGVDAFVRAAELRAEFGVRTPDALHLAVAQLSRCQEMWTNDRRLATASRGLAVDVLA